MVNQLIEYHKDFLDDYIKFGFGGELNTLLVRRMPMLVSCVRCFPTDILSGARIVEADQDAHLVISNHGFVRLRPKNNLFIFFYGKIVFEVTVEPSLFKNAELDDDVTRSSEGYLKFIKCLDTILEIIVSKYHQRCDSPFIKQWDFY